MSNTSPEAFPVIFALVLFILAIGFTIYAFWSTYANWKPFRRRKTAPEEDTPANTKRHRVNSWTGSKKFGSVYSAKSAACREQTPDVIMSNNDNNCLETVGECDAELAMGGFVDEDLDENPALMSWKDLSCTYPAKDKNSEEVTTLQGASGIMRAGELVAIMGGSGGGKSTLIDILSGRKTLGKLGGELSILGTRVTDFKEAEGILKTVSAYVPQQEHFFPTQTPEEAVEFVANLKLGRDRRGDDLRADRVRAILDLMGIPEEARKRPIGGALAGGLTIRGLSGGERKRLALACAVAVKPSILFLDEITSGLDSENAVLVIELLQNMCRRLNVAAAVVIHQPSFQVFEMFDRLVLLSKGHCIYSGRLDGISNLYGMVGCTQPEQYLLPGDLMTVASKWDPDSHKRIGPSELAETVSESEERVKQRKLEQPTTYWRFSSVFHRSLLNHYMRNVTNLASRVGIYATIALLLGCFFWRIGKPGGGRNYFTDSEAQLVIGAVIFLLQTSYLLPFAQISTFFFDKKVFASENPIGLYPPWMYSLSQFFLESWVLMLCAIVLAAIAIPMIALWNPVMSKGWSFFQLLSILQASGMTGNAIILFLSILLFSQDLAFLVGSGLIVIFLAASGGFVPHTDMQSWIVWLQWISPVKYSLQGVTSALFMGTETTYAKEIGLDNPSSVSANLGVLVAFFATLAVSTMIALSRQKEVR